MSRFSFEARGACSKHCVNVTNVCTNISSGFAAQNVKMENGVVTTA